jgi:hypothetical protein
VSTKLQTARFHVDAGPASLFERVRQVFAAPRRLKLHGAHFNGRAAERGAPRELIEDFDPAAWELMTADVRTDTGKFVRTAWRRTVDRQTWWIAIGFHDTVQTVYPATPGKTGFGDDIVRAGPLWQMVDRVNRALLAEGPPTVVTPPA